MCEGVKKGKIFFREIFERVKNDDRKREREYEIYVVFCAKHKNSLQFLLSNEKKLNFSIEENLKIVKIRNNYFH